MDGTSNVMRPTKGFATKTPMSCLNVIKLNNASVGGVDVIDQKTAACPIDRKRKFRFYLRMFLDLINIAIMNSHIVYMNFKIVVVKSLIGRYNNRQRSFSLSSNQVKCTGVITTNGNTNTHAETQREAHTMQFFAKMKELTIKNCIFSVLWSVLVLYQMGKLLSKTPV